MGRTERLGTMMAEDLECEIFIRDCWNCLYNDLKENPISKWNVFDEIAGLATLDWLEHKGLI